MLPVINNVFRVALHWSNSDGGYAVNVVHVSAPGFDEAAVRAVFNGYWQNDQQAVVSTSADQDSIEIIKLDGSSATQTFAGVGNSAGQCPSDPIPNLCALVSLRTVQRGPQGRGRIYLPFVGESCQDNGVLDVVAVPLMQAAWDDFVSNMAGDGCFLGVASYAHEIFYPATQQTVEGMAATQRRRLDRLRA